MKNRVILISIDLSIPLIIVIIVTTAIILCSCENPLFPVGPKTSILTESIDSINLIDSIFYDTNAISFEGKFTGIIDSSCMQCNVPFSKNNEWIIRISPHMTKAIVQIKENLDSEYKILNEDNWNFNSSAIYIYDPLQEYNNYYYKVIFTVE